MKKPALKTQEKKPDTAVLIVDKIGVVGEALSLEFSKDYYVVFLSSRIPKKTNEKISFIKFKGKIPKVPKNRYSKIFLIDDGSAITKDSSFSFVEEARRLKADFYFLGSVRNFDVKHSDELAGAYTNAKVLVFGDLFDDQFLFDHDASITKFIYEASNRGKIKVPGEGLSLSYPITFEDTIKLIERASYISIPQKIVLLFYKNPITDISLAHIFQKINPEINVDFVKEYRNQEIFIPLGAEYAISKYNLKDRLEEINLDEPKKVISSNKKKKNNKLNLLKPFLFLLLLIFFLIFLPFSTMYIYSFLGEYALKDSIRLTRENDFDEALNKSMRSESFFEISEGVAQLVERPLALVNRNDDVEYFISRSEIGKTVSVSVQNFLEGLILIENIYDGKSVNQKEDFTKGMEQIRSSYSEVQKLDDFDEISNMLNSQSAQLYEFMGLSLGLSESLPSVLGLEGEKKYLILFQDSNELRPGGGKITTVGNFTINNMRIDNFETVDVKELDNKLDVRIEPPFPIRRYLPSVNYLLEDSNFDPDFVKSAISASTIYALEDGEDVDGIIGVDLNFLANILREIGPVYIEEIEKNVTHENVFQISSEYEQIGENEYFITKLLEKSVLVLSQGDRMQLYPLLNILGDSIQEKHMLFAFKDSKIQSIFTANNFSSSLIDNRTISNNKVNDYFGISESNLGKNKINFYISRSLSKKNIISSSGSLSSEVTIAFKNNSQAGSSFAKTYKNYIQIILPEKVKLSEIYINGKKQDIIPAIKDYTIYEDRRFQDPSELEVDQRKESEKSIFGFLINVSPSSIETIKINYDTSFKISNDPSSPTDYSLFVYKQPGIQSFPFNLTYDHDGSFYILPEDSYSNDVKKDELIESTIIKK